MKKIILFFSILLLHIGYSYAGQAGDDKCGDNLQWSLDTKTGVLTITGSGDMYNYSFGTNNAPWYEWRESITSIVFPEDLTSIGTIAFLTCSALTSVTFPNTVKTIEGFAFAYCSSLTSIMIPNSVRGIYDEAFSFCTSLTSITCEATTPPQTEGNPFMKVPKDKVILYVPENSIEAYKAATKTWSTFPNIRPIGDVNTAVENILEGASLQTPKKILHNGQIVILTPEGKKYNLGGQAIQ